MDDIFRNLNENYKNPCGRLIKENSIRKLWPRTTLKNNLRKLNKKINKTHFLYQATKAMLNLNIWFMKLFRETITKIKNYGDNPI